MLAQLLQTLFVVGIDARLGHARRAGATHVQGTLRWVAPELFRGEKHVRPVQDVYAWGCIAGTLLHVDMSASETESDAAFGIEFPGLIQTATLSEDELIDDPVTSGGDSAAGLARTEERRGRQEWGAQCRSRWSGEALK